MQRFVLLGAAVALAACSADAGITNPAESTEATDTTGEALSFGEHCDTAPASMTFTGAASATTPSSYGNSQCASAYLIDVVSNGYSYFVVSWSGNDSTSESACPTESAWYYEWSSHPSGPGTPVDAKQVAGSWLPSLGFCIDPAAVFVPPEGHIRIAVSARQAHANGTYSLRPVFVSYGEYSNPF
jgi:hypothetical protein